MNFNRINNLVGWAVGLIACLTYILTAEAGGSLWDCGEFVSSCFKVQIPTRLVLPSSFCWEESS